MRRHGAVTSASGLGPNDHLCWVYEDPQEFVDAAVEFLADGLAAGQRLMYVTGRSTDQMLQDLASLGEVERLWAGGGLILGSASETFDLTQRADPEQRVTGLAHVTEQALADGYTGVRIAADVTEVVAEAWRASDQSRVEHLSEHYMASGHPVAAICAYDRRILGDEALADVVAVHPLVHAPAPLTGRQLFFDGDRLVLAGEVDSFSSEQIQRLLDRSHLPGSTVTLDVADLAFIDARGLYTLARWGQGVGSGGGHVVIEGGSRVMRRAWSSLGFDRLTAVELGKGLREFPAAAAADPHPERVTDRAPDNVAGALPARGVRLPRGRRVRRLGGGVHPGRPRGR